MSEGGELKAIFGRLPFGYKTYGSSSNVRDLQQNLREEIEPRTRRYQRAVHEGGI